MQTVNHLFHPKPPWIRLLLQPRPRDVDFPAATSAACGRARSLWRLPRWRPKDDAHQTWRRHRKMKRWFDIMVFWWFLKCESRRSYRTLMRLYSYIPYSYYIYIYNMEMYNNYQWHHRNSHGKMLLPYHPNQPRPRTLPPSETPCLRVWWAAARDDATGVCTQRPAKEKKTWRPLVNVYRKIWIYSDL